MRIIIDRNMCGAWAPACEECFSTFVKHNFPVDRACIMGAEDDSSEDVTIVMRSGSHAATLKITPENIDAIAAEGWRAFAGMPDEAFEIKPPHGDDIRARQ